MSMRAENYCVARLPIQTYTTTSVLILNHTVLASASQSVPTHAGELQLPFAQEHAMHLLHLYVSLSYSVVSKLIDGACCNAIVAVLARVKVRAVDREAGIVFYTE